MTLQFNVIFVINGITLNVCVNVTHTRYEKLKEDPIPWYCPDCATIAPFTKKTNEDIAILQSTDSPCNPKKTNVKTLDKKAKDLFKEFQVVNQFTDQSVNLISYDY